VRQRTVRSFFHLLRAPSGSSVMAIKRGEVKRVERIVALGGHMLAVVVGAWGANSPHWPRCASLACLVIIVETVGCRTTTAVPWHDTARG